ncbi:MAG: hypothetical protein WCT04_09730 [Planctomycetota bacterium]
MKHLKVNHEVSNWALQSHCSSVNTPINSLIEAKIGGQKFRAVFVGVNILWNAEDICRTFDLPDDECVADDIVQNVERLWNYDSTSLDSGHIVVNNAALGQLLARSILKAVQKASIGSINQSECLAQIKCNAELHRHLLQLNTTDAIFGKKKCDCRTPAGKAPLVTTAHKERAE